MALVRWAPAGQPARDLQSFQREVNRLFGSVFDSQAGASGGGVARRFVPAVDLVEEDERYVLRADLPGVREQDVKVEVQDNVLTVSGERHSEREERKEGYYRVERASGNFSRSLVLPEGIDPRQIQARIEHGVLEVSVPKPEQRTPHRVAIEVSGEAGTESGEAQQTPAAAAPAEPAVA
jgi:HSP20 family protein